MISATVSGSFDKIIRFLKTMESNKIFNVLDHYGATGVSYLSSATPRLTGLASASWSYEVIHEPGRHIIWWSNDDNEGNINVAVILQYGHGTGTGGYVEGIDYINPALRPLFEKMIEDIWRQVTNA